METKKRNRLGNLLSTCNETLATTVNGLANGPENKELEKLLKCPSCLKIPLPPIYTCETGHVVCYECMVKEEKCPICLQHFTRTRSFSLETIVETSTFYCDHKKEGCQQRLTASEYSTHRGTCKYRPMKCHLGHFVKCNDSVLYMSEYVNHLSTIHCLPFDSPLTNDWKRNVFHLNCIDAFWEKDDVATNSVREWPSTLLKFNGQVFATQVLHSGSVYYLGLIVIANKLEAAKYAVSITVQKSENHVPKYELTTTVPSVREFESKVAVEDLPFAALDKDLLERFGELRPNDEDDNDDPDLEDNDEDGEMDSEACSFPSPLPSTKFCWTVRYEIKTLVSNASSCEIM